MEAWLNDLCKLLAKREGRDIIDLQNFTLKLGIEIYKDQERAYYVDCDRCYCFLEDISLDRLIEVGEIDPNDRQDICSTCVKQFKNYYHKNPDIIHNIVQKIGTPFEEIQNDMLISLMTSQITFGSLMYLTLGHLRFQIDKLKLIKKFNKTDFQDLI